MTDFKENSHRGWAYRKMSYRFNPVFFYESELIGIKFFDILKENTKVVSQQLSDLVFGRGRKE
jgi:hypothetical protein